MLPTEAFDLIIVGAGPAGLAAARAAAISGARICLIDDNPAPGGQVWRDGPGVVLPDAARRLRDSLASSDHIKVHSGTRVVALAPVSAGQQALLVESEHSAGVVCAPRLILATGARELLLPFPGWTLPGVTGAGGLQALIKGGLQVTGQRIVLAGSGPLLLAVAATARCAGAQVLHVLEQARRTDVAAFAAGLWRWPGKAVQALSLLPRGYRTNSHVLQALALPQPQAPALGAVSLSLNGRRTQVDCQRLACGFGLVPNSELARLLGCALNAQGGIATQADQATSLAGTYAAGECSGIGGADAAQVQGAIAGFAATEQTVAAARLAPQRARWAGFSHALQQRFTLQAALRQLPDADTLVCRCEDVTHAAIQGRSGFIDAKLHSRCGMGPCQGRVCATAAQFLYGWTPPAPGALLAPTRLSTLALLDDLAPTAAPRGPAHMAAVVANR